MIDSTRTEDVLLPGNLLKTLPVISIDLKVVTEFVRARCKFLNCDSFYKLGGRLSATFIIGESTVLTGLRVELIDG